MREPDLILLHAPSYYDFRKNVTLYGPISDVIPSTPIFDMYPLGFVSIIGYLRKHGYETRIINLAARMLRDRHFDVDKTIEKLRAKAFGIDLHWLVHAHGSMEIARIAKKHHPDTPVIVGGTSASYYHMEIMADWPQVDYVLRGDSTEKPLLELMQRIETGKSAKDVPNLTSRDESGKTQVSPISHVPGNLDDFVLDYSNMVDLVISHRDLAGSLPYESWLDYPFTALIVCKGCTYNCITCGGSKSAYQRVCCRDKVSIKTPGRIAEEMAVIEGYVRGPIFLIGDLRVGGLRYAENVLHEIKRQRIDNPVVFELFTPSKEFVRAIAENSSRFGLEISPESHDERVRQLQGRPYLNHELEATIDTALKEGCIKLDVFFMIGLPGQTASSTLDTVEYARHLLTKDRGGRLHPFIAPLAPFLDPGSLAFESPEGYGYKLFYKTLKEHRDALAMPTWKHYLNYETTWMSRDQIVAVTYEAIYRMTQLKLEFGLLDHLKSQQITQSIRQASAIIERVSYVSPTQTASNYLEPFREMLDSTTRAMASSKEELRLSQRASIRKGAVIGHVMRHFLNRRRSS